MDINICMIGYAFMGKAHSFGINNAPFCFKTNINPIKKIICGRTEDKLKHAAIDLGWEEYSTNWKKAVARDDIDLVVIASPNKTHKEIAIEASKNGKHVFCEKPLGMNSDEAREMLAAVKDNSVIHFLGHNYRRVPAISLAKKLIKEDKLGEIYHFRGVYLQDWIMDPKFPAIWKLSKDAAGFGPHGDLNSHIVDLSRFLVGEIKEVVGMKENFIEERPNPNNLSDKKQVDVEDMAAFLAKFENGAVGTFESSRFAGGRKNHERIEINGSKGSIVFNFEKMNELLYWTNQEDQEIQGFKKILVTEEEHPYIKGFWPPGHLIGYENTFINEYADLFRAIENSKEITPNFYDGLIGNKVLDAVAKSWETKTWVQVDEM